MTYKYIQNILLNILRYSYYFYRTSKFIYALVCLHKQKLYNFRCKKCLNIKHILNKFSNN